jgi:hypothetical protein
MLPPLLFVASIQIIEQQLQSHYTNEIEVVAIGTKHTQTKDLKFLDQL